MASIVSDSAAARALGSVIARTAPSRTGTNKITTVAALRGNVFAISVFFGGVLLDREEISHAGTTSHVAGGSTGRG